MDQCVPSVKSTAFAREVPAPIAVYHYIDKITVWLTRDLSADEENWLRGKCGNHLDVRANGERVWGKWGSFTIRHPDKSFVQRLQLFQPNDEALHWLAQFGDTKLTFVEFSLDWIFQTFKDCMSAFEFGTAYNVKKYHGRQKVANFDYGRYSGPRRAANVVAVYCDMRSKVTGEINCCHWDWRIKGTTALRAAKIETLEELVELNFREFWQQRLFFFSIDRAKLGRLFFNQANRIGRRSPRIVETEKCKRDVDTRVGATLVRICGGSTQSVIDTYRSKMNVASCLIKIDVDGLLPPEQPQQHQWVIRLISNSMDKHSLGHRQV